MNPCVNAPWVALVLRPRTEVKVQTGLAQASLETFVPWYKVRRVWSDRTKTVAQNLFPGYVFCRSSFERRFQVLRQPGVQWVVTLGNQPAIVSDEEIASLKRAVDSGLRIAPWPRLEAGERVRIEEGALAGTEGTLVRDAGLWRVVISVNALERSIAVEVDREVVRRITECRTNIYGYQSSSGSRGAFPLDTGRIWVLAGGVIGGRRSEFFGLCAVAAAKTVRRTIARRAAKRAENQSRAPGGNRGRKAA